MSNNKTPSHSPSINQNNQKSDLKPNISKIMFATQQNAAIPSVYDFTLQAKETRQSRELREGKTKELSKINLSYENSKKRPSFNDVDPQDIDSIIKYACLQNIACATSCCGDSEPVETVKELVKIIQTNLKQNEYVHLFIWDFSEQEAKSYNVTGWDEMTKKMPWKASQWFGAKIENHPQDLKELNKNIEIFQNLYNTHHANQ